MKIKEIFFGILILLFLFYFSLAEQILRVNNFSLFYPSYYVRVDLYNIYQTTVLLDSRNQNRSIYVEFLQNVNINDFIKQTLNDLGDLYEKKYKILVNEEKSYNGKKLFVLDYTFINVDKEYRSVKYFLESQGGYLGVYCMGPSKEFDEVYNDFLKIFDSIRSDYK